MSFLDKDLNDHIQPKKPFYKLKRFWAVLLTIALAGVSGDYASIIPSAVEAGNLISNG